MAALPADLIVRFVLAVLATWRVTHLLAAEDGPGEIVFRARRSLGTSWFGSLADCFNCLSLFVAAPAALFVVHSAVPWVLTWLALSGGACLLERLGERAPLVDPFAQSLKGNEDVLRQPTPDPPRAPLARDAHTAHSNGDAANEGGIVHGGGTHQRHDGAALSASRSDSSRRPRVGTRLCLLRGTSSANGRFPRRSGSRSVRPVPRRCTG